MKTDVPLLSRDFQRLYCDATVYDPFSTLHPISFRRVLPFQSGEPVVDDRILIQAEEANLADINENTRRQVIDAYQRCKLLSPTEAADVTSAIGYYGTDFFELMGLVYANAGMFICALRWYREFIQQLETQNSSSRSDIESVYASVGYCLYSLGLFEEAISWSKSCIGPRQTADAICQVLIGYEEGMISGIERSGPRARYRVVAVDPAHSSQTTPRLTTAMKEFAPFQEFYFDWVGQDAPTPELQPDGYPFKTELDGSTLPRHKMNLIFATCGLADVLVERGYTAEAKRLLFEAAMVEPTADFVWDRIKSLS